MIHFVDTESLTLMREIATCPRIRGAWSGYGACAEVVQSQGASCVNEIQVPEPWNGGIQDAPLLFISSNPAFAPDEDYPTWADADDGHNLDQMAERDALIHGFFADRFEALPPAEPPILNARARRKGGGRLPASRYLGNIYRLAQCIYGEDWRLGPGTSYAVTEVVHCKSNAEAGVAAAAPVCAARYLNRVIETSCARVILALGETARIHVGAALDLRTTDRTMIHRIHPGREEILVCFLPHPGAWGTTYQDALQAIDVVLLRSRLRPDATL